MTAELIGELTLVNNCLRVNAAYSDASYLILWQPEFSLKAENDSLHILNKAGQVVAKVGEEVYLSGGEVRSIDHLDAYVQQQLPSACPGPYWIVGLEVRPNIHSSSELTTVDLVQAAERMVFLIRKQPMRDEWAIDKTSLTGQLVLFDRCPKIIPNDHPVNYTPVWPPDYDVQFQEGEVAIVDGLGQIVAQVGEEVRLSGSAIPVDWNLEGYRQLREKLPGECNGPYWIVDDVYRVQSTRYVNISPYEKNSFKEAEQRTGFAIPLPDYVPDGYVLEGIYMYPHTESADAAADVNLPPRSPFEAFQVIFTHDMGVLILRLEGGDTRDEETSARTGGDIPTDFDIQGNMVDVNGTIGVTESGLEKMSIIGAKMHSRLMWRLPCTSTKMPLLTGLFLVVESNTLSTSELLEIAKSVQPCIPHF